MRSLVVACLLLLTSCSSVASSSTTTSTTVSATAPTSLAVTTSSAAVSTTQESPGCPAGSDFTANGQVIRLDQPASDANILGLIAWDVGVGCERFALDFETNEGAPATTPPSVAVEYLDSGQVLRIHLDLERTVITDQLVESSLVDRLYVVRALEGGLYVDLHLSTPTQARAALSNSPSGLSVELEAAIEPFTGAATISDQAVVLEPLAGTEVDTLVEVNGYARIFEGNVVVIATNAGQTVAEANTQAADWAETWGEFQTTVEVPPGEISLFVGEESASDGTLSGAVVEITAR